MANLKWQDAGQVRLDSLVATLNRAILEKANVLYSIRVGRQNNDGKISQFLRVDDLASLAKLGPLVSSWIDKDIDAIRVKAKAV